jgi:hypothetical protein
LRQILLLFLLLVVVVMGLRLRWSNRQDRPGTEDKTAAGTRRHDFINYLEVRPSGRRKGLEMRVSFDKVLPSILVVVRDVKP